MLLHLTSLSPPCHSHSPASLTSSVSHFLPNSSTLSMHPTFIVPLFSRPPGVLPMWYSIFIHCSFFYLQPYVAFLPAQRVCPSEGSNPGRQAQEVVGWPTHWPSSPQKSFGGRGRGPCWAAFCTHTPCASCTRVRGTVSGNEERALTRGGHFLKNTLTDSRAMQAPWAWKAK